MEPDRREGKGKWIALAVVGIIVIGLGGYYLFSGKPAKEPAPRSRACEKRNGCPGAKAFCGARQRALARRPPEALPRAMIGFAKRRRSLSSEPGWAQWLANQNLIRRLTAAVVNISEGKSPRKHLRLSGPPATLSPP